MRRKSRFPATAGACILVLLLLLFLGSAFLNPYGPNQMDGTAKNMAPSFSHFFGTDNFGRDIAARCMEGVKTTFLISSAVVLIGAVAGTLLGAITGYFGGVADEILMRINDVLLSFPGILLALVFVGILGTGKYNIILALGAAFIPSFARVVRSEFVAQREMDYVKNARLMGAGNLRIMFFHILPNTWSILFSSVAIGFNNAVLAESGMSYLGLGVQPPSASLGRMLFEAQSNLFAAPWCAVAPGLILVFLVLGVSLISEREGG